MIVVSDTSPLNYLVLIDAIDVLPRLFGNVYVPPAVMLELQHPRTPESVKCWAQAPPDWLVIESPSSSIARNPTLDPGEAEAIALALEVHAVAILVDEKIGRRIAKTHGLATLGTITVLELAAEQELIDLRAAVSALQLTSFHVSKNLIDEALACDAARRPTDR